MQSLIKNIPDFSFYDFGKYFSLLKDNLLSFKAIMDYLKMFVYRIKKFLVVLFLTIMYYQFMTFHVLSSDNSATNQNDLFGFFLSVFSIVLLFLLFFYFLYKTIDVIYFTNTFWLDKLGYEIVKKDEKFFSIGKLSISSVVYYNFNMIASFLLTIFLSIFNIFDKKYLIYSVVLFLAFLIFPLVGLEVLGLLVFLILIFIVIRNFFRYSFFYQYYLTTDSRLINSYKISFESTHKRFLKIFLTYLVLYLIIIVLSMLIFNFSLLSTFFIQGTIYERLNFFYTELIFQKSVNILDYLLVSMIMALISTYTIMVIFFIISISQIMTSTVFKLHYDEVKSNE
ncbi:MAG: hypothetical protein N3E37_04135 [Candidatus Micrarchaeota archaeon]|nr:hypothetical protein [Candidatus Micrarchaeota archaeon]